MNRLICRLVLAISFCLSTVVLAQADPLILTTGLFTTFSLLLTGATRETPAGQTSHFQVAPHLTAVESALVATPARPGFCLRCFARTLSVAR